MTKTDPARDLNVLQAAEVLKVHPNTVRHMADDGRLGCYRLPGSGFRRFRRTDVEAARRAMLPSYHDLHITTATVPRTSIANLPFGLEVTCTRAGGWQVWDHNQRAPRIPTSDLDPGPLCIAGEYGDGLRLDVDGHVICDSLTPAATAEGEGQNP